MNRRFAVLLPAVMLLSAITVSADVPQVDRDALIALYNATNGDNWTNNTEWIGAAGTECDWFGVFCSGSGGVSDRSKSVSPQMGVVIASEAEKESSFSTAQSSPITSTR